MISEYDFYTFNSIQGSGGINVTLLVSPSLNSFGADRPIGLAIQVDNQPARANYFIPPAPPGKLPPQWSGNDGYVANAIVSVVTNWNAAPGAHTLKARIPD